MYRPHWSIKGAQSYGSIKSGNHSEYSYHGSNDKGSNSYYNVKYAFQPTISYGTRYSGKRPTGKYGSPYDYGPAYQEGPTYSTVLEKRTDPTITFSRIPKHVTRRVPKYKWRDSSRTSSRIRCFRGGCVNSILFTGTTIMTMQTKIGHSISMLF